MRSPRCCPGWVTWLPAPARMLIFPIAQPLQVRFGRWSIASGPRFLSTPPRTPPSIAPKRSPTWPKPSTRSRPLQWPMLHGMLVRA